MVKFSDKIKIKTKNMSLVGNPNEGPKSAGGELEKPVELADLTPNQPEGGVEAQGTVTPEQVPVAPELGEQVAEGVVSDQPEGALHREFGEQQKGIDEQTAQKDFDVLTGKSAEGYTVEDIRYNSRLLKKKDGEEVADAQVKNLKEETARRIRAYTTDAGNGWFQLDYAKLGADKNGLTHELYIGLGDILLDPDVKNVLVEKGGQKIKAHRGIVASGQHSGRVGFLDDANQYVATYTGDKFRILSSDKMAADAYVAELKNEDSAREKGRTFFRSSTVEMAMYEKDVTMKDGIKLEGTYQVDGKEVPVEITNETINAAAAECAKGSEIPEAVKKKNLMKLLNYIADKVDVPAYAMLAILKHECGIQFPAGIGDRGKAVGMGQFHDGSWATQKRDPKFQELVGQVINENPSEAGRNRNIFVDLVGVATCLKFAAGLFGFPVTQDTDPKYLTEETITLPDGMSMTRLSWIRMYYHVPSYATDCAKIIKAGGMSGLKSNYQKRFVEKTRPWLLDKMHRYVKFSDNSALASREIKKNEHGNLA